MVKAIEGGIVEAAKIFPLFTKSQVPSLGCFSLAHRKDWSCDDGSCLSSHLNATLQSFQALLKSNSPCSLCRWWSGCLGCPDIWQRIFASRVWADLPYVITRSSSPKHQIFLDISQFFYGADQSHHMTWVDALFHVAFNFFLYLAIFVSCRCCHTVSIYILMKR